MNCRWTVAVLAWSLTCAFPVLAGEAWTQYQFDARHSGNAAERDVQLPLGLLGAVPLSDSVLTAPVVADNRVYAVDAAGTAYCIDAETLKVQWKFATPGGAENCSNVSSPAILGSYLHFGTCIGKYYVLDRQTGKPVKEIDCHDPIFSAPVASGDRVYFATLGAQVYALRDNGEVVWTWDFVREVMGFQGDRWNGDDWQKHKQGRVNWRDHFCSSRDLAVYDHMVVIPAGGRTVFLQDEGATAKLRCLGEIPNVNGQEYAACFGQSIGPEGEVYVQWHRRDNAGRVEVMRLAGDKVETTFIPGTQTAINIDGLLSFSPVAIRGQDIYRCRPQAGFGLCRHSSGSTSPAPLGAFPSIAPPVLLGKHAVVSGLDGTIYVVPLSAEGTAWSFKTSLGRAISAPVCVADGRIYVPCEDGYLYVLGPNGQAAPPDRDLGLHQIRSPLTGPYRDTAYDWYTNYGNFGSTNTSDQHIRPPLKIKWIRRYEGTFKHLPVCGGGRMYTHISEGQIFAVEQETGRLLWRRYWPDVYLSFTSPLYYRHNGKELLIVPQAGMKQSRMRCLDAATGALVWETPFTGSPSWSRQSPPVIFDNLAIYASGSGDYQAQGTDKAFIFRGEPAKSSADQEIMSWIYTHDNPYYPKNNKPLIWTWDLDSGKIVWQKDFSQYGSGGNDCGLCLMDGRLYYSTFFGYSADQRRRRGQPDSVNGLTAALDPRNGNALWTTTAHSVTAGCTISGRDGRLYLGGYNQPDESTRDRYVVCLDAKDGSLVWRSDPLRSAVNVVSVGDNFVFSNASGSDGYVFDKQTGKIRSRFNFGYACTRFTCSGDYVLGANMDMIDLANDNKLVSTGPCIDSRECVGSTASNGRLFYTSQASGLQVSLVAGDEARKLQSPWEK